MSDQDDIPQNEFYTAEQLSATFDNQPLIPIEQVDPKRRRADLMGMKINEFGDWMPYWHGYPELIGYVRHGNARPVGDEGYVVLSSEANASGVGSIFVQFPPPRNSIDRNPNGGKLGAFDGLSHRDVRPFVRGFNVFLMSDSILVNFGPEMGTRYIGEVPLKHAQVNGLYVTYYAPPGSRNDFLLNRQVVYGVRPAPDTPVPIQAPREGAGTPPSPTKSDL